MACALPRNAPPSIALCTSCWQGCQPAVAGAVSEADQALTQRLAGGAPHALDERAKLRHRASLTFHD